MKKLSVTMSGTQKLLGWIYYPVQLLVLPFVLSLANLLLKNPLSDAWVNFLYFAINFLCVLLIFGSFLLNNGRTALQSPFRTLRCAALGLIGYWVLSYGVQVLITVLRPDFFNVNDAYLNSITQDNFTLMAIGTVFLVPVAEEVLYRGLMFGQLYNRSRVLAYVVSVAVFALVHVVSYIGMYDLPLLGLCLLQYLPAGLALGWAYASADSIWAPILMHMAINQIGILSMR